MLKKVLKSIIRFRLVRDTIRHFKLKKLFSSTDMPDDEYLIKLGKVSLGYKMDLKNPKTFNEKLNWYKLNYYDELMAKVVDKSQAKDYVISKGLSDIVIKTLSVTDKIDDIEFNMLPNSFVIKNTNDSGGIYVCKDKKALNIDEVKSKLTKTENFTYVNGKHVYRENLYNKYPNKIIVEECLKTDDGRAPFDYKFFCFNGEPKFLYVTSNREISPCLDFFDIDFNHLDCKHVYPNAKETIFKPENYDKMIEICRILSKDFPHVRVDLYNIKGKIYFGELTFFTSAGFGVFKPKKYDLIFGEYFNIDGIKNI